MEDGLVCSVCEVGTAWHAYYQFPEFEAKRSECCMLDKFIWPTGRLVLESAQNTLCNITLASSLEWMPVNSVQVFLSSIFQVLYKKHLQ